MFERLDTSVARPAHDHQVRADARDGLVVVRRHRNNGRPHGLRDTRAGLQVDLMQFVVGVVDRVRFQVRQSDRGPQADRVELI